MPQIFFHTVDGLEIPSVDEAQMRQVDRIAVEDFGLGILQMMENAGRNLALVAMEMLGESRAGEITIFAGPGGNGGGGICATRHLHNRGYKISLILSKPPQSYSGSTKTQLDTLQRAGFQITPNKDIKKAVKSASLIIDALIGYSLQGAPRGTLEEYINLINRSEKPVLSLDIPSGIDSSTGKTYRTFIQAEKTVTLALPKLGLCNSAAGEIILADIGIPPEVFQKIGVNFEPFFGSRFMIPLERSDE